MGRTLRRSQASLPLVHQLQIEIRSPRRPPAILAQSTSRRPGSKYGWRYRNAQRYFAPPELPADHVAYCVRKILLGRLTRANVAPRHRGLGAPSIRDGVKARDQGASDAPVRPAMSRKRIMNRLHPIGSRLRAPLEWCSTLFRESQASPTGLSSRALAFENGIAGHHRWRCESLARRSEQEWPETNLEPTRHFREPVLRLWCGGRPCYVGSSGKSVSLFFRA
jgi:hypothetical protein